jgi:hypothetical protein
MSRMQIDLIQGPAQEPVSVSDMMTQMDMPEVSDPTLSAQLTTKIGNAISAARADCENYCRRVFVTQIRQLRLNGFPGLDWRYNWQGYPAIKIPLPPLQSIYSLQYVDTSGNVQVLPRDTSYGSSTLAYGYQLMRGSETECGVLVSAWARPWPPTRMIPSNVIVRFRCGYGGPLTASIAQGSSILEGPAFNPDDAPQMAGEVGLPISVPGAGAGGATLTTNIASVDQNGVATLAAAASMAVTNAAIYAGIPVPPEVITAITLLAQFYYEQGSIVDQPLPRVVTSLLQPYVNGES